MDVQINGKLYRAIDDWTTGKLEHLAQLAQIEIDNYKRCHTDFDKQLKLRPAVKRHYEMLLAKHASIQELIHERVDW